MVGGASIEQIGNTLALAVKLLNVRWAGTGSSDRQSAPDSPQATPGWWVSPTRCSATLWRWRPLGPGAGSRRRRADRRSRARRSARSNPVRADGADLERGRVVAEAAVEI